MKTNVPIELDDTCRNLLANYFAGKVTKRLATRKDVTEFVLGCVDMAIQNAMGGAPAVAQACTLSPAELAEVTRLRKLGKNDSYIRGWVQVMRRAAK